MRPGVQDLAEGGRIALEALQREQQKRGPVCCVCGPLPAVVFRDLKEASRRGDFQMVSTSLPLCFPSKGEEPLA